MKTKLLCFTLFCFWSVAWTQVKDSTATKTPKLLYNGLCGWAIYNDYPYPADPDIYVIDNKDTIRFYNKRTRKLWLTKEDPRWWADKHWKAMGKNITDKSNF